MRKIFIWAAGVLGGTASFAQTVDTATFLQPCSTTVYTVDDMLLNAKIADGLAKADNAPAYKGGIAALKKYFAQYPLTDTRAQNIVFRVHIGFLADCNGRAGNFRLISKGKGDLQELGEQVLKIVQAMPQNWVPATEGKKPVDCYQVLSFTVVNGVLEKVSYR